MYDDTAFCLIRRHYQSIKCLKSGLGPYESPNMAVLEIMPAAGAWPTCHAWSSRLWDRRLFLTSTAGQPPTALIPKLRTFYFKQDRDLIVPTCCQATEWHRQKHREEDHICRLLQLRFCTQTAGFGPKFILLKTSPKLLFHPRFWSTKI